MKKRRHYKTIFGADRFLTKSAVAGYCTYNEHKGYITDRELKNHNCIHCNNGCRCKYFVPNRRYVPLTEQEQG